MDPDHGFQPISSEEDGISAVHNGEIYNFRQLLIDIGHADTKTGSDSESLIYLYQHFGNDFCHLLNGIFGFVVTKNDGKDILAARDHCGIKPLY
jgi:asparagine synthase (glutamine-hydrolysing)